MKLKLNGANRTTFKYQVISSIQNGEVWLYNGPGNDFSGPFDAVTGKYLGSTIAEFSMEIIIRD